MTSMSHFIEKDIVMADRPVRLADVAIAAGTSTKTASRVLNGNQSVNPEISARVKKAADDLGYRLNPVARSLRTGSDSVVGLIAQSISEPFFARVIGEVERVAMARDVVTMVSSNGTLADDSNLLRSMVQRRIQGLIITPQERIYRSEEFSNIPAVFIDRAPLGIENADVVSADDYHGAELAVKHLASFGHRRIAVILGPESISTIELRKKGYLSGLAECGIPLDKKLIKSECISSATAEKATRDLLALSQPPTAIFSSRGEVTIGVVSALHQMGLHQSVALISFGDMPMLEALQPAVSVLEHSPELIGNFAATRLFNRIDGDTSPPALIKLATPLLARGSGEIRAPIS